MFITESNVTVLVGNFSAYFCMVKVLTLKGKLRWKAACVCPWRVFSPTMYIEYVHKFPYLCYLSCRILEAKMLYN